MGMLATTRAGCDLRWLSPVPAVALCWLPPALALRSLSDGGHNAPTSESLLPPWHYRAVPLTRLAATPYWLW